MNCVCPVAGYCETHRRKMSALRHRQCRDEPGYFDSFQSDLRKQSRREIDGIGPNNGATCIHRGEPDGTAKCGCGNGRKTVPAYRCEVHGRCSDDDAKGVAWCRWCQSFQGVGNPGHGAGSNTLSAPGRR